MNELDKQLESLMGADFISGTSADKVRQEGGASKLSEHLDSKDIKPNSTSDIDALLELEEGIIKQEALIQTEALMGQSNVKQVEIIEGIEEYDETDIEKELQEALASRVSVRDIDLTKDLPTLERVHHDEYILITGAYTTLSFEYLNNRNYVPDGEVPIYIQSDEGELYFRSIQATPDIIFNMKYFLVGFEFHLVKNNEKSMLDNYTFLGKLNIE